MSNYDQVLCLLLCWDDDTSANKPFNEHRESLMIELRSWNFRVQKLNIERSNRAYCSLAGALLKVLDSDDLSRTLLIVYYGGHGAQNKDKEAVWYWYFFLN